MALKIKIFKKKREKGAFFHKKWGQKQDYCYIFYFLLLFLPFSTQVYGFRASHAPALSFPLGCGQQIQFQMLQLPHIYHGTLMGPYSTFKNNWHNQITSKLCQFLSNYHNFFAISKIFTSTTFYVKTYFEKSEEENEKMKMKIFNFFIIYVVWIKVVSVDSSNFDHDKYTNYFR